MARRKKKRRRSGRGREPRRSASRVHEWVGGRSLSPFYVTEGEPHRPEMVLWLELPEDLILAMTVIDRATPVSLGDTLVDAMEDPMVGPPRRPQRVRVASADLAADIRAVAPEIEIVVAPTPELDRIIQHLAETLPEGEGEGPSYLENGRVSEAAIERLFLAAKLLYGAAPWQIADDDQVVRLDIPELGVEGAAISIIGALGESTGLVIFPSLIAFERFLEFSEARGDADGPIDLRTTVLSLNFERAGDLPDPMRREAAEHGWPVAGPAAYPWVQHRDRDGMPRPLSERDVRVVAACAMSVATFFIKYGSRFEDGSVDEPICESFFDGHDLEVRLTVPYEAGPLFSVNDPPSGAFRSAAPRDAGNAAPAGNAKVGRNQPCPCGSGRKYKKCCLGKDEAARVAEQAPAAIHEIDQRLVEQMLRFSGRRFGEECLAPAERDFADPDASIQLVIPWAVYCFPVKGKPIAEWYLEERRRQLSNTERTWLEAQRASWLSVWEVLAVEPGRSITLRDLLTAEERSVHEVSGSRTLARRDALLARIVDHGGISVLGGSHPRPLPPVEAAEVVRRIRARLRRKRAVPAERLRDEKAGRYMIARWEEAVEDLDIARSIPPRFQNTDGEDILLTAEHFELEPRDREAIAKRLAALEDVDPPAPDDPEQIYVFARQGNPVHGGLENTLVGRATLSKDRLRVETNSIQRADALRARIEDACGELVRHRAREHSDPLSAVPERGGDRGTTPDDQIPPEMANRLILEAKTKHYADWADHPLPALDGKTPRDAIRTKAGREQVDLLLKDCENHEARLPEGQQFDFSGLRRELGLEGA